MKNLFSITILLLIIFSACLASAQTEPITIGHIELELEFADKPTVTVKLDHKPIKIFTAPDAMLFDLVASYADPDIDYLIVRTHMGSGLCAASDFFVIKVERAKAKAEVSTMLTACGETPPVGFSYPGPKHDLAITISGHQLKPEISMQRWIAPRAR